MMLRVSCAALALGMLVPTPAQAQTVEELQQQIDELKAQVKALTEARTAVPVTATPSAATSATQAAAAGTQTGSAQPGTQLASSQTAPANAPGWVAPKKHWYDRLQLRGYTQMRYNAFVGGDDTAPSGLSRLRSVHDASINDNGGFSLRRVRLVLQGDITDNLQLYLQHDFGSAVNNQSNGERREHYGQLRDAYVDWFLDDEHSFRLRFGQSKVPFGWENLQSSSNRLTLDRSDAMNSGVPSERDLGIAAYYTPPHVQAIWDRLSKGGQKLFGNYGAFGVAAYNGQGTNRTEQNGNLMTVALATWPFELDGLGGAFEGQVLELGGSAMLNKFRPEVRTGGVTAIDYDDNRVGVHAILYPQPFGVQAEWNWGRGPEFDTSVQAILEKKLSGGYVQLMYDLGDVGMGRMMPYGRWQRYRGGWKASTNAPRLETDELELGVEWQIMKELEFTVAYANMKRSEADERRTGRAEGDLIRTQIQWNY